MGGARQPTASNWRVPRELVDVELTPSGCRYDPERDRAFGSRFPRELLIPRRDWRAKVARARGNRPV